MRRGARLRPCSCCSSRWLHGASRTSWSLDTSGCSCRDDVARNFAAAARVWDRKQVTKLTSYTWGSWHAATSPGSPSTPVKTIGEQMRVPGHRSLRFGARTAVPRSSWQGSRAAAITSKSSYTPGSSCSQSPLERPASGSASVTGASWAFGER